MKTEQLRARTVISAAESLPRAAALLRAGGLVAFPTETVYGLGANALDPIAIARIFEAKGRPTFDPLIVHIADRADLSLVLSPAALEDPRVTLLADVLWPGPLTIVAPAATRIPGLVRSGLPTVGVRLPDHDLARALIRAAGTPIAAPSANLFGQLSPTTAEHVLEQLDGRIDAVLLGGATRVGVESSVVSLVPGEPARLLRPGGVPRETIAGLLTPFGPLLDAPLGGVNPADAPAAAPGMSASHYAPRAPLRIISADAPGPAGLTHVALLAPDAETLADLRTAVAGLQIVAEVALSESLDPVVAASKLFDALHRLDAALRDVAPGKAAILTTPYPEPGLGLAIADRLRRRSGELRREMAAPRSNWVAEAISGDALRRFPQSILGQAIFAVGLSLMVNGGIGLPSWEILHQGLGYKLGITIGQAAQLSGLFVILLWIPIRQTPGLGTISNIVVIGFVMDLTLNAMRLLGVPAKEVLSQNLPVAVALTVIGTALVGLGSGIYIGSGNGPGPRDGLMTGFHRLTGRPIWIVRTIIEIVVGIIGILLGGTFGFGTIWFAFTIGPQVQFWLARVDPSGRAKKQSAASSRR